ncbi:hypothetical protein BGY98DRAFT_981954 [Russula aff. rugulosa BPL654]|nr:hypothetical protein BGY98DRAFT_981954 [Russula aff. rugulosa BPL654]
MFQLPSVIAMSIAATRIYRNLADFIYGSTDISLVSFKRVIAKSRRQRGNPPRRPRSANLR